MDKKISKKNIWKFAGYGFFALIVVAILCVRFMYGSVIAVSGQSMVPTFNDTDYVFATILHEDDELAVGDIVILEEDGVYLIKRIAGMPGDTLEADYVKGIPAITLGEDEYYVLGDNWKVSRDSRMFGPVSRDRIEFKYADIHWSRAGMIISLLIPAILFIAQLSIVFIPSDKKKEKDDGKEAKSIEDEIHAMPLDEDVANDINATTNCDDEVVEITLVNESDNPENEPVQIEESTVN
jgi:signal peptidase I